MKVLLVWPNSLNEVLGWGDLGAIAEPLALEYLGSALACHGHEVKILDLRLHPDKLNVTLHEYLPDLVGITAYSMHVNRALGIAADIKQWKTNCSTIIGGHHATFLPSDFFHDPVDFVVSGEGCEAISVVANALSAGLQPPVTDGLWQREGSSNKFFSFRAKAAPTRESLGNMPLPDRSLTAADRHRYFIDWMKPVALLRTTMGCPYRCSFCSIWKAAEGQYLRRETDQVIDELKAIPEDKVFLVDDEAFINQKRMVALAHDIQSAGIKKQYFTYCRIDTLLKNQEAIKAWKDIGLERLFIGIDAISGKDLDFYNKGCNRYQIEQGLDLARSLGIDLFAQFVVNTDYSEKDFTQLVRFIEHNHIEYPSFTVLTPLPGTALLENFENITEFGHNDRPNWDLFDCQNPVTATKLPQKRFKYLYRDLYRTFKGAYTQYREHNTLLNKNLKSVV